jgi:S1-C subfamily serine protease
MFCVACGESLQREDHFCPRCGRAIDASPAFVPPRHQNAPKSGVSKLAVLGFVGGLTLLAALSAYVMLGDRSPARRSDMSVAPAEPNLTSLSPGVLTLSVLDLDGSPESTASGFVVRPDGLCVTNWHVLAGATGSVSARTGDGRDYRLNEVAAFDEATDLVAFRLHTHANDNGRLTVLPLGTSTQVPQGQRVWTIGAPLGLSTSVSDGLVSAIRYFEGRRYLQISAPVSHGSSGGPVISTDGHVIGVIKGGLEGGENLNFAIPVEEVIALLSRASPIGRADSGTGALEEAASRAFADKQWAKASQFYSAVVLLNRDPAAAYNAGLALVNAGNNKKAAEYLKVFLRLAPISDPAIPRVRQWLGRSARTPRDSDALANTGSAADPPESPTSATEADSSVYQFRGMIGSKLARLTFSFAAGNKMTGALSLGGGVAEISSSTITGTHMTVYAVPYLLDGEVGSSADGPMFSGQYRILDTAGAVTTSGAFTLAAVK